MNELSTMSVPPMVWPLIVLLLVLVGAHSVRETINPIIGGMVRGLAAQAQSNATSVFIAFLFGLSASLAAFYDVFSQLGQRDIEIMSWHQYFSLVAKVANPFVVAVLAYATQNKFKVQEKIGNTNPPMPTQ